MRHRRTPDGLLEVSAVGIGTYAEALTELELAADEDLLSKIGSVLKIMKSGQSDLSTLEAIRKDLLDYVEST